MDSFIIIGAGECGVRAAQALREQGFAGRIVLVGEEPHLPYERPPLSKDVMVCEAAPSPKTISTAEALAGAGIECVTRNAVTAIDRAAKRVTLFDGTAPAYDKLLLATGATPRRLPGVPESDRIRYLRAFDDALAIRAHLDRGSSVAILGGGFIGLELAASARGRGAEVTVIEAQPRILMRGVPEEIAAVLAARHRDEGVTLLCGDGVARIEEREDAVRLLLASGRSVEADLLVVGIGAVPVTQLAAKAGLEIANGIAVDGTLATSDPDIFAAGDCCSFPLPIYDGRRVRLECWRNAQEQGGLAARNMLGAREPVSAVPWFWSDQYGLTLQVAGLADGATAQVRRDLGDGAFILFHLASDGRLLAASGTGAGNAVARDIRLAEMLIAKRARPDPAELASPETRLKKLLAA